MGGATSILKLHKELHQKECLLEKELHRRHQSSEDVSYYSVNSSLSDFVEDIPKVAINTKPLFLEPCIPLPQREKILWAYTTQKLVELWVKCCQCSKWRRLKGVQDPHEVCIAWHCAKNTSDKRNTCEAPESNLRKVNLVEVRFSPGVIVWAKIPNFPFWPAMIDVDPDFRTFFLRNRITPYIGCDCYNVSFFDVGKVTRAWVKNDNIFRFSPGQDASLIGKGRHRMRIIKAYAEAIKAYNTPLCDRLRKYCFAARYSGRIVSFHNQVLQLVRNDPKLKDLLKTYGATYDGTCLNGISLDALRSIPPLDRSRSIFRADVFPEVVNNSSPKEKGANITPIRARKYVSKKKQKLSKTFKQEPKSQNVKTSSEFKSVSEIVSGTSADVCDRPRRIAFTIACQLVSQMAKETAPTKRKRRSAPFGRASFYSVNYPLLKKKKKLKPRSYAASLPGDWCEEIDMEVATESKDAPGPAAKQHVSVALEYLAVAGPSGLQSLADPDSPYLTCDEDNDE